MEGQDPPSDRGERERERKKERERVTSTMYITSSLRLDNQLNSHNR